MKLNFLCLSFAMPIAIASYAQDHFFVKGILKEKTTDKPIEFASVGITNTTEGTAANERGEFRLKILTQQRKERLKISSIGYITKSFSIDSLLLSSEDTHIIYLNNDNILLDEMVVKSAPIDPAEIIRQASQMIEKNYCQKPFNLELLSTINANDSITHKKYKVESVLFGYYDGYNLKGKRKFEIVQKRTSGNDPLTKIKYGYWPSFEIYAADLLTDPSRHGVFNLDRLKDFKLNYTGVSVYENDTVYTIEYYAPKPNEKITGYGIVPKIYRGNIYITTKSFAVVRHEITTSSFRYHVIYKKINNAYFPYYFSGLRINNFKLEGGSRKFKMTNTLIVNRITLENVKPIDAKANEYDVNKIRYDEKFWNDNYPAEQKRD